MKLLSASVIALAAGAAVAQEVPQASNQWYSDAQSTLQGMLSRQQNTNRALNVILFVADGNGVAWVSRAVETIPTDLPPSDMSSESSVTGFAAAASQSSTATESIMLMVSFLALTPELNAAAVGALSGVRPFVVYVLIRARLGKASCGWT